MAEEDQDVESRAAVDIIYTNWKGRTSRRRILPYGLWYGTSEYHESEQWFVYAHNYEDGKSKDFAWRDMLLVNRQAGADSPLEALLDEYWDLAYRAGREGRTHDTPAGDEQRVRSILSAALAGRKLG